RPFFEVSEQERREMWDDLYDQPGFGIWLANFKDIFVDEAANAEFSAYMADRIRARVDDPQIAEKLIPKDHGFGVQRVPLETKYLETYNKPNVKLVDLQETPIVRVTAGGIETTAGEIELDVIVYATGFDAITGAFDRMEIRGVGGQTLRETWIDGPITSFGLQVPGFPNMLMPNGPQSAAATTNFPRGIELGVDWCTALMQFAKSRGFERIDATDEAASAWNREVIELYEMMLMRKAQGWFTGYNSNIAGHEAGKIRYMVYNGGTPKFRETIAAEAANDYPSIAFS
ncbi:MAG: cyclohexanone monooxygenase, partial [Antricoccus sp.]